LDFVRQEDARRPDGGYNNRHFRMTEIQFHGGEPRITWAPGTYYEHFLSQASLRWELVKLLSTGNPTDLSVQATSRDAFKRRREFEEVVPSDSLKCGTRRCASLVTKTLVIERERMKGGKTGFKFLILKRSQRVDVLPGCYDVTPAGMFESFSLDQASEWSIRRNFIREFMEELLDEKEEKQRSDLYGSTLTSKESYRKLDALIKSGCASFATTGLSIDLAILCPEISTVFVINKEDFEALKPKANWEFDASSIRLYDKAEIEELMDENFAAFLPTGIVTIVLGLKWLEANKSHLAFK